MSEWISVKDRLPNKMQDVIGVVVFKNKRRTVTEVWLALDETWRVSQNSAAVHVTHWMPLPEPPKEVE